MTTKERIAQIKQMLKFCKELRNTAKNCLSMHDETIQSVNTLLESMDVNDEPKQTETTKADNQTNLSADIPIRCILLLTKTMEREK